MKYKVLKFITVIASILLGLLIILTCGCAKMLTEVPFTLNIQNTEIRNSATLIKSATEFEEFLSDDSIFASELSEEFILENAKYDDTFFESKDLIAVIIKSLSHSYYGCKLYSMEKSEGLWVLKIRPISKRKNIVEGYSEGEYFTYYITVEKDNDMQGAELTY